MAVLAGGCGSSDDWSQPHPKPTAVGALGPGFFDPTAPPAPEATEESALPADPDQPSDENLWSRSRDFDWGD